MTEASASGKLNKFAAQSGEQNPDPDPDANIENNIVQKFCKVQSFKITCQVSLNGNQYNSQKQ